MIYLSVTSSILPPSTEQLAKKTRESTPLPLPSCTLKTFEPISQSYETQVLLSTSCRTTSPAPPNKKGMLSSQTPQLSRSSLQSHTSHTTVDDTLRKLDTLTLKPISLTTKGTLTSSSPRSPLLFSRLTTEIEKLRWTKPS